ncbi:hypothetical protein LEP1GSC059_0363 [Leptospira noguchii serovar Panama str. CZ214]|uniref:Uncharacterized protein n=1 Tax=Leptospira noguchii serovar Panama str. CZ214 TaxID=1001595 RepID=T0FIW8_9LEPT|nr:hypothetical protein LEP1GSC059_0363 [Leptospira noguchii serovar Panama str. CZ214]
MQIKLSLEEILNFIITLKLATFNNSNRSLYGSTQQTLF